MKKVWISTLAWAGIALAALIFAFAAPHDARVMGHLPELKAQFADRQPVSFPKDLPAERTLALVTFHRDHRKDAESWINGLKLRNDPSIAWVRMPVVNDPKDPVLRGEVETRLMARYASDAERSNLLPVFTDRAAFVQSTGLGNVDKAHVLVVNREGEVLARVSGQYDEAKAQALLQTLRMQGF
jgi:hypothetical protein